MSPTSEELRELDAVREEEEDLFARDINGRLVRLDEATLEDYEKKVTLEIDGRKITVPRARPSTDAQGEIIRDAQGLTVPRPTTIFDAASELFVKKPGDVNPIPVLCHQEHMRPVAVCRICAVEIHSMKGGKLTRGRKLMPACQHRVEDGMVVHTIESPDAAARQRVRAPVRVLTELLTADHLRPSPDAGAEQGPRYVNELDLLARRLELPTSRFTPNPKTRGEDKSSLVIAVDHDRCVLCDRCVRACDEVKENHVIGRTGKGYTARIGFDLDDRMGESSCVQCGECMVSCPTGALTFRRFVRPDPWVQEQPPPAVVTADELRTLPLFAGVSYTFLKFNEGSVVRRRVKAGDILCREGEYGFSAFILLSGKYEVSIQSSMGRVQTKRSPRLLNFLGKAVSRLTGTTDPNRPDEQGPANITVGGSTALSTGRPVAVLDAKDIIIGEMTCMNNYPRSATVRAVEDGEVLEILRNVLYMLQRNKASREMLDRVYRERALHNHLLGVPLFAALPEEQRRECVAFLRERVDLIRVDPGQVIFLQGEPADHFYLVRLGFVKVSEKRHGQERVLDYLGPGSHFGEIGLLSRCSNVVAHKAPEGMARGVRTATCSALDHVELVRVRGEHFKEMLDRYPVMLQLLEKHALELLERNVASRARMDRPLGDFLQQGLFLAQSLLVLDLERCTRCDECTRACADSHAGVTRLIREGLRFDRYLVATSCRSCLDPYCMVGCPVDAIHRSKSSMEIVIEKWCIGCGLCADNCPYDNISMVSVPERREDPNQKGRMITVAQRKATTCDLCREVVGENEDPSCVYACPHDAAFRMTGPELLQNVEQSRGRVQK